MQWKTYTVQQKIWAADQFQREAEMPFNFSLKISFGYLNYSQTIELFK